MQFLFNMRACTDFDSVDVSAISQTSTNILAINGRGNHSCWSSGMQYLDA